MVEKHSVQYLEKKADVVITSGGGFPLDATFYQMSKPLICARDILNRGGTIILACECREGLGGPEFSSILKNISKPEEFFQVYSRPEKFLKDQWCAQNIFQALDHAGRIFVYSSGLKEINIKPRGIFIIDDIQSTIDSQIKDGMQVVVVPEGPYVVGLIENQPQ
jgi:nickel-dependent lactate racemase